MKLKCNEKIAVHAGYGYIDIGKFIGVEYNTAYGTCFLIKINAKNSEAHNMNGTVVISIEEFEHNVNVFRLKKHGYKQWLKKIEKEAKQKNIYHKWNIPLNKNEKEN